MIPNEELLRLPFDQYQRYRLAADIVAALDVAPGSRIVDVGGAPGRIEDFLPDHHTVVVDVEGPVHGRFVMGSGAGLPFANDSFSVALALDTLEHVPAEFRSAFLAELRRVAPIIVVSAPFASPEVELAERALGEFIEARLGTFDTLDEHAEHGLPLLEDSVKEFDAAGWSVTSLPSGYLPRWLVGMLLHHELLATGLPDLPGLHAYYNATVSPIDGREPSYRHVIVAVRDQSLATIEHMAAGFTMEADPAEGVAALTAIVSAVFAQRLGGVMHSGEIHVLHERLEMATARVAELERDKAVLTNENAMLRRRIADRIAQRIRRGGKQS